MYFSFPVTQYETGYGTIGTSHAYGYVLHQWVHGPGGALTYGSDGDVRTRPPK